jgi:hypothetical protein
VQPIEGIIHKNIGRLRRQIGGVKTSALQVAIVHRRRSPAS